MSLSDRVNWEATRAEVTRHLQELIRLNTVNPPGNESLVANYLKAQVEAAGLEAQILEAQSRRGNFVTRIKGSGQGRPLLLMAHSDVVSVEEDKWTHPPFGGGIHDGMIWGRGAVDTKNLVSAELMIMLTLARQGVQLDRDLILCIFADEEAGGRAGAKWMWDNQRGLIDAEFAINEGGGAAVELNGTRFFSVQTGEKGGARMRIIARADPGHASVPRDDTAMLRMGRALQTLSGHIFPTIMTDSVRSMLDTFAEHAGDDVADSIAAINADPSWKNLSKLPLDEISLLGLRAVTRNTAVPTIIHGGHRINVIPGEVVCDVDGRVLPGQDPAAFVAQVRELLGDEVIVEPAGNGRTGIEADPASPLFDTIRDVVQATDSNATVTPYLVSGGTDAASLPGIKVYGFMPGYYSPAEMNGAHNHDERVSIDNLLFGTQVLYDVVTRYCNAREA
jgi:acetylornithine deacetylase/succinyl-diaminopimelate desuccinylase-like protein